MSKLEIIETLCEALSEANDEHPGKWNRVLHQSATLQRSGDLDGAIRLLTPALCQANQDDNGIYQDTLDAVKTHLHVNSLLQ